VSVLIEIQDRGAPLDPFAVRRSPSPPLKLNPVPPGIDEGAYGVEHSSASMDRQLKLPCCRPAERAMSP